MGAAGVGGAVGKRRHHRRPVMSEINVTPFVDVMLVLLIIFMLATPLLLHRLDVTVARGEQDFEVPRVTLAIGADGEVRWDGVRLAPELLQAQLRHAASLSPQPMLVVDADGTVRYERVSEVLATVEAAGIERVGFAER